MTNERWAQLKQSFPWFRSDQDEVTAYVERFRKQTIELVDRVRHVCAEALELKIDQIGGMESAIVALAAECWARRKRIEELQASLRAAKDELQDRADHANPDNPGYDGTDAAHPAWWRGEEHGSRFTAKRLLEVAERGRSGGVFGGEDVEAAASAIEKLHLANSAANAIIGEQADEAKRLQDRIDDLLRFKESVDEALNSGDGVYRP